MNGTERYNSMNLPPELVESIEELERLWELKEQNGNRIGDVLAYKSQLAMFLTDIKVALAGGKIPQHVFDELKHSYL